jgi:hypothetical protein
MEYGPGENKQFAYESKIDKEFIFDKLLRRKELISLLHSKEIRKFYFVGNFYHPEYVKGLWIA